MDGQNDGFLSPVPKSPRLQRVGAGDFWTFGHFGPGGYARHTAATSPSTPQPDRSVGSSMSRTQSPPRLIASVVSMIARPGNVLSHQAVSRYCRPWPSIPPQDGLGGWTPSPRKLRVDSSTISRARSSVASTITGDRILGKMWRNRMRLSEPPSACTDCTNSRSLIVSTIPRPTRAYVIQPLIPTITISFQGTPPAGSGPNTAMIEM